MHRVLDSKKGDLSILGLLPEKLVLAVKEEIHKRLKAQNGSGDIQIALYNQEKERDLFKKHFSFQDLPPSLPEMMIVQGYSTIFSKMFKQKYRCFFTVSTETVHARDFSALGLKDPAGNYSILGLNPIVLAVDMAEVRRLKLMVPKSWRDLVTGSYGGKIDVSGTDTVCLESLLLHIYKDFGVEGVLGLYRNFKEDSEGEPHAVSICTYAEAKAAAKGRTLSIIWPSDGAVLTPIFLLVKKNLSPHLSAFLEFFSGPVFGLISSYAFIPSLHPDVHSRIPSAAALNWLGWQYLMESDPDQDLRKIKTCIEKSTQLNRLSN